MSASMLSECRELVCHTLYQISLFRRVCAKNVIGISSVIRQKGESQNGCFTKTKHAKFSAKTNIFYPLICTRTCANQWVKNARFFGKYSLLCFLETPVLGFALLPCYRQFLQCLPNFKVIQD